MIIELKLHIIAQQLENRGNNARCKATGHGISIIGVSTLIHRMPYDSWCNDYPQYEGLLDPGIHWIIVFQTFI